MEGDFTNRFKGQKVWEVVTELGRAFQDCENSAWKFVSGRISARDATASSS